jgi:hypothetical protein
MTVLALLHLAYVEFIAIEYSSGGSVEYIPIGKITGVII